MKITRTILIILGLLAVVLIVKSALSEPFTPVNLNINQLHLMEKTHKERYDIYLEEMASKGRYTPQTSYSNVSKVLINDFLFAANLALIAYYTTFQEIGNSLSMFGVELLGYKFNDSCQAYAGVTKEGMQVLAIRGTEFTEEHHNIWEVWDDIDDTPLTTKPHGAIVHSGFYTKIHDLWPDIVHMMDLNKPIWIIGHSLGGVRAHLIRSFIPHTTPVRITTFGAPKGANYTFWDANMKYNTIVERVVANNDFAPDYPWMIYNHPEEMFYWLNGDKINYTNERDYVNISFSDHKLLSSYLPLLIKLAS